MVNKQDLERFLQPQAMTHAKALAEVRSGLKLSHWIWWELPQLRGLGRSQRAEDYGLQDLDEATRYLGHPVLGKRLMEICMALLMHQNRPPEAILGPIDAQKLRSMATLFARVPGTPDVFQDILDQFFGGLSCPLTQSRLAAEH
ncbi:hypothetical protein NBRC116601_26570 [Cognatishimia sp. WU-CL00825]|uniref:DUF1810 domain-containing protein n=1 Tax=Cognatishimia sp. WU-CL00825 TaxID=3127658 RepID=UPI00310266CB